MLQSSPHLLTTLNQDSKQVTSKLTTTIRADVVLGQPQKNCAGHGICRIIPAGQSECQKCLSLSALVSQGQHGMLCIRFEKQQVIKKLAVSHFNGYFLLEAPFTLPSWLCRELTTDSKLLKAGRYPVFEENLHFLVIFSPA